MEGCAGTTGRALGYQLLALICLCFFADDEYGFFDTNSQDTNFQIKSIHEMAVKKDNENTFTLLGLHGPSLLKKRVGYLSTKLQSH